MKINKFFSFLSLLFILSGCAAEYKPLSFGQGYSELALNQDTYVVSFKGNALNDQNNVTQYMLRRCAELTQKNGYKYFIILDSGTSVNTTTFQTPTTVDVRTYGGVQGHGSLNSPMYIYSSNSYSNSHATINPGQQIKFDRYEAKALIKMFPHNNGSAQMFDANIIINNFK